MNEDLYSILAGTAGLGVAAVVSLFLTLTRKPRHPNPAARRRLMAFAALTVLFQTLHFLEELLTDFPERFPQLLGLRPWSDAFFVPFNLIMVGVWMLSIAGVRMGLQAAFFPLWFLGIASVANGAAHPIFALLVGGYFPGLYSSLPAGIAGVFLLRSLTSYTRVERMPTAST